MVKYVCKIFPIGREQQEYKNWLWPCQTAAEVNSYDALGNFYLISQTLFRNKELLHEVALTGTKNV